jgi:hypothetical protein
LCLSSLIYTVGKELTFKSEGLSRCQDVGDEKDRVRDAEGDQQLIKSAPGKVKKNKNSEIQYCVYY